MELLKCPATSLPKSRACINFKVKQTKYTTAMKYKTPQKSPVVTEAVQCT